MASDLISLSDLFSKRLFRIPDYQRGYAWLQEQLVDFWEDLVNLQPDRYHYTGLLSIKLLEKKEFDSWGDDSWLIDDDYKPYHIVDGQQRITTCVILLNEIVNFMKDLPMNKGTPDNEIILGYDNIEAILSKYICRKKPPHKQVTTYLFGYEIENPSAEFMRHKIFGEPHPGMMNETYYTKNLQTAKDFFKKNIKKLYEDSKSDQKGLAALNTLYKKLTQKLKFSLYEIDAENDVFVAFETMNNRGKKLTNFELLKNRLIYLTTLYSNEETDKPALRKKINEAWKEVYYQLGRNKKPLADDEFLRAHWFIYFKYSRKYKDEYIRFLLKKFSSKGIFEENTVVIKSEDETIISDDITDADEVENVESEEIKDQKESKLRPKEIGNYVDSLKDMAEYWYCTYFPSESNLPQDEKECLDRLNRIGIGYFRPLVAAIISRPDISSQKRVEIFKAIERFIFIVFRLGYYHASYRSSYYYSASNQIYDKKKDVEELCREINKDVDDNKIYASDNFARRIDMFFEKGNGYYDWTALKYFLFEYETALSEANDIDKLSWSRFTKSEKDKVSIEHIYPQTPDKDCWSKKFARFNITEKKRLTGALGNLLPLSLSINIALQNDCFEDKKRSKGKGCRGYDHGSHSEIEVSSCSDWNAEEIHKRTERLLNFMEERWDIKFNEEQRKKLMGISFVTDKPDA